MPETALVFLLLYAVGICLTLFVRPMYGLYTYIVVFYVHPPSRWWGASLPDLRWSLIAAFVTLFAIFIHRNSLGSRRAWHSSKIIQILILYTLWMWIQLPWAISVYHFAGVVLFTKYVLLIYLIYSLVNNEDDFRGFCIAHLIGCAYFGYLIYLAPDTGRLEGVGGPGVNDANTLGMHLATGLMFAAFLLLGAKGWARWLIVLTIPFILNGLIQTETRGALVGLFLGGIVTIYLKPKKFRRIYYSLAVVALVGFVVLANEAFIERMRSLTAAVDVEQEWDSSAESRIEIVKSQMRMFADHPLGVGHQGTAYLSRQYIDERWWARDSGNRASHNTVMSIIVDQGVPGILLFCMLGVVIVRILRALKRMDEQGLPESLGLYRTMLGGAIFTIVGSGMFAQYLKAEVMIWCLVLLAALWELSNNFMVVIAAKK